MQDQAINILCATDDNYVPYCGIMLTSVFQNNPKGKVCVYVLIDKPISANNQYLFEKLASAYSNKIFYCLVDKHFLEKFPIKGMDYWSIATYYRLYAELLIPHTVEKILYLDCDIIVNGSLLSLWNANLDGYAAAAVPDIFNFDNQIYQRLQYDAKYEYFNAGVLLINLKYWREHHIGQQCLDYIAKYYERIYANDQDVLNAVLYDKKIILPLTYNFQIQFLAEHFYHSYPVLVQQKIKETSTKPVIIHYAYNIKPWSVMYWRLPYKRIWKYYKYHSLWRGTLPTLPQRKTFNYLVKRYILWPLGIMRSIPAFKNI